MNTNKIDINEVIEIFKTNPNKILCFEHTAGWEYHSIYLGYRLWGFYNAEEDKFQLAESDEEATADWDYIKSIFPEIMGKVWHIV